MIVKIMKSLGGGKKSSPGEEVEFRTLFQHFIQLFWLILLYYFVVDKRIKSYIKVLRTRLN